MAMPDIAPIPVAAAETTSAELRYVTDALRSTWISSTGPYVGRFEEEFARLCGTRAAIAVSSGTAALHLAVSALGVGPGDEVVVPSLTYIATANAVRYAGAEPVFVDIDPQTWCIDPRSLEKAITDRTRGVIAVHLYGHPADMDPINGIAKAHGLWVVEDAAEALTARYHDRPAGGLSDVATFSFYGNKILTCGEGGALTVNDHELERRIRLLRGQGMDPERRYHFPVVGYNYRLTNVACAILCAQMERLEEILRRRRHIFDTYDELLQGIPGIGSQPLAPWARRAPWLYCITVDSASYGCSRDSLMASLQDNGIETRPFFPPVHHQPPYEESRRNRRAELPVTGAISSAGLNLPTYNALRIDSIKRIADVIRSVHR